MFLLHPNSMVLLQTTLAARTSGASLRGSNAGALASGFLMGGRAIGESAPSETPPSHREPPLARARRQRSRPVTESHRCTTERAALTVQSAVAFIPFKKRPSYISTPPPPYLFLLLSLQHRHRGASFRALAWGAPGNSRRSPARTRRKRAVRVEAVAVAAAWPAARRRRRGRALCTSSTCASESSRWTSPPWALERWARGEGTVGLWNDGIGPGGRGSLAPHAARRSDQWALGESVGSPPFARWRPTALGIVARLRSMHGTQRASGLRGSRAERHSGAPAATANRGRFSTRFLSSTQQRPPFLPSAVS